MCHQTVGLVQKACEDNGIVSSTISIVDEITQKLGTKRYLSVPYELGFPLGPPGNYKEQKDNVRALISRSVSSL